MFKIFCIKGGVGKWEMTSEQIEEFEYKKKYVNGKLEGEWKLLYKNGNIKEKRLYKNGKRVE